MAVNITLKVTSFGQLVFEIGKPAFPIEARLPVLPREEVLYREPLETASRIYEVRYQEELINYVIPHSAHNNVLLSALIRTLEICSIA